MDIFPTFAALAGIALPTDRILDGVDLWPALTGEGQPRQGFHYFRGAVLEAIRQGPWKLHLQKGLLFQLEDDPGEANDLAAAQPDVVAGLRKLAEAMESDLGTTSFGPGCRSLGRHPVPEPLMSNDGTIRAEARPESPVP
jgi:arylsulfatase A-like enzyme